MKKFISGILYSIPFLLSVFHAAETCGQVFQNICPPGITFFSGYNRSVMAFRLDSAQVMPNGDSVFYSYLAVRDTGNSGGCVDMTHGSILGRKVLRTPAGWFCFFNRYGDSIWINTGANVTDTWKFCDLSGGNYLQARVNQILYDSVLGLVDQVKIIALQAKNAAGTNVSHPFNQKTFRLSKHAGLTQFFDVYYLPKDTAKRFLSGRSDPPLKLQNLLLRDIYNLDTGDVIHLIGHAPGGWWRLIKKVIDVTKWGSDSVLIGWERCENRYSYPNYWNTHDTISEKVVFTTASGLANNLARMPGEFYRKGHHAARSYFYEDIYHHRDMKGYGGEAYYIYPPWYPCWVFYALIEGYTEYEYTEGLGKTKTIYKNWLANQYMSESMVYYRKGNETHGTPLADDCTTLVGIGSQNEVSGPNMDIRPVPVETKATIRISGADDGTVMHLKVYNMVGYEVQSFKFSGKEVVLDRTSLPSGVYMLVLVSSDGRLLQCRKIVLI